MSALHTSCSSEAMMMLSRFTSVSSDGSSGFIASHRASAALQVLSEWTTRPPSVLRWCPAEAGAVKKPSLSISSITSSMPSRLVDFSRLMNSSLYSLRSFFISFTLFLIIMFAAFPQTIHKATIIYLKNETFSPKILLLPLNV